jgi:hypothetical protein
VPAGHSAGSQASDRNARLDAVALPVVVATVRDSVEADIAVDPRPLPAGVTLSNLFAGAIPLNSRLDEILTRDDAKETVRARDRLLEAAGVRRVNATALEPCMFAFGVAPPPPGPPPPTPEVRRLRERCRKIGDFHVAVISEPVAIESDRFRVGVIVLRPHAYEQLQVTLQPLDAGGLTLFSFERVHWIYS